MKKQILFLLAFALLAITSFAQLSTIANGGNKKAWVGERVGLTDITIRYDRPGVKGREGKIWGQLVHNGFADLEFGTSKASPWRAGANENTTIEFSTDVKVEGRPVKAGRYGLFIAYDATAPELILSNNSTSWGSYFYDPKEDVLRVKLKPMTSEKSVEWLQYEFMNQTENSATIALKWEKKIFPFNVEVDYVNTQLESFRKELRSDKAFSPGWEAFVQAARFTLDRNVDLEEGLVWADLAINARYVGESNFTTLSTKAEILQKLGRSAEADTLMKKALQTGSMQELHTFGRQLLQQKKNKEALEVFLLNSKKHPTDLTPMLGLVRTYSANGDYKSALKYANKALPLATEGPTKDFLTEAIVKLKAGKDVN